MRWPRTTRAPAPWSATAACRRTPRRRRTCPPCSSLAGLSGGRRGGLVTPAPVSTTTSLGGGPAAVGPAASTRRRRRRRPTAAVDDHAASPFERILSRDQRRSAARADRSDSTTGGRPHRRAAPGAGQGAVPGLPTTHPEPRPTPAAGAGRRSPSVTRGRSRPGRHGQRGCHGYGNHRRSGRQRSTRTARTTGTPHAVPTPHREADGPGATARQRPMPARRTPDASTPVAGRCRARRRRARHTTTATAGAGVGDGSGSTSASSNVTLAAMSLDNGKPTLAPDVVARLRHCTQPSRMAGCSAGAPRSLLERHRPVGGRAMRARTAQRRVAPARGGVTGPGPTSFASTAAGGLAPSAPRTPSTLARAR